MIRALTLSLGQIFDPPIIRVLIRVLAITGIIFALLAVILWRGADMLADHYGYRGYGEWAAAAGIMLALLAGWLLFRVVAIAILGIFADEVVEAVERRHYPQALATAQAPGIGLSLRMGLASAARALGLNLLALPLYIVLLVTGIGGVALFALVNALLLGRDLGEMVAIRHMPSDAVRAWLRTTRLARLLLGLVVTGLFVVPVVNLIAPILGAAMATHMFHGRKSG